MSTDRRIAAKVLFAILILLTVPASRAGAAATFSIGGKASGLAVGASVTLLDNGVDSLKVTANGSFTFKTKLASKAKYDVTISVQPAGQLCAVAHGAGTVAAANISSIIVACKNAVTIGGNVSGLKAGTSVTLLDNGGDADTVTKVGPFTFKTPLVIGAAYKVTVGTQPAGQKCSVTGGTGTVTKKITTVAVACVAVSTHSIGGTLSGLNQAGASVTLLDNGGDALAVTKNGAFTFPTKLTSGSAYLVTVGKQPATEACTVGFGKGTVGTGNVTTIRVICADNFSIGGKVSGLKSGSSVTLLDNLKDSVTVGANGAFTFPTRLLTGARYSVTIKTQPTGEKCSVGGGTGAVGTSNITSVAVSCSSTTTHTIGGSVTGLGSGQSVTLLDNGGDALTVPANGTFTFKTPLIVGARYSVTVGTQPAGENCAVGRGVGIVGPSNITNITVICTTNNTFSIGGTVSGLTSGQSVTLLDNGADSFKVTANGAFAFPTKLATGVSYNVTVGTQPILETCSVLAGSGKVASANVTNVTVTCAANPTFSIGGSVSGLTSGQSVTLLDNGGDSTLVSSNTTFTFPTKLASGANYAVTVGTQPTTETCTVTNGSGKVASANITNVTVTCAANPTFSIGGSVSGLTGGTLTLLDNGGDAKNITANGTFTFTTKIATGKTYDVTVGTQPAGLTCTPSNNTGTVGTANITNVAIACSSSGGGGGHGGAFWIPFSAAPVPATSDGQTGVFVIPSDKITTSPIPQFVTTTPSQLLGLSYTVGTGTPISLTPTGFMFASVGKDGNTHVYGMTINDTATLPTPVQISSLSLPSSKQICIGGQDAQTDIGDPTTLFVLLEIADINNCGAGASTFEVVHWKDSASTAPVVVSLDTDNFDTVYTAGKLTGLVVWDQTAATVDFYDDNTFTSPTQMLTGVSDELGLSGIHINFSDPLNSNTDLFLAITATPASTSGLYFVNAAGKSVSLTHQGSIGFAGYVTDNNNLYFQDITSSTATKIYQVPLSNGTPLLLYTGGGTSTINYDLLGTNQSVIAVQAVTGTFPSQVSKFYTLPIGTASSTLTQIGATAGYTGNVSGFLAFPIGADPTKNKLFVTYSVVQFAPPFHTTWSSLALALDGSTNPTPTANSVYEPLGINGFLFGGGVWQVTGITDTNGGWGGGTANITAVDTLANTPFTTTGGGDFVMPAGDLGDLIGFGTEDAAFGFFSDISGATPAVGSAADINAKFLYTIPIKDTVVTPF